MTQQLTPHQHSPKTANPAPLPLSSEKKLGWVRIGIAISLSTAISTILLAVGIGFYMAVQAQARNEYNNRQQLILDNARAYKHSDNFEACLSEAAQVQSDASWFPEAQQLMRDCQQHLINQQIEVARQLADRGELKNAIALIMQVPDASSHPQVQQLVHQLSQQMYDIAWKYYKEPTNQFNEAIAVLQAIPESSPAASKSQAAIQQMQTEWFGNERHLQAAQAALQKGDLITARREIELVTRHAFWQHQVRPLLQTLAYQEQEQLYVSVLQSAEAALEKKEHRNAIELAQQLPDHHPWAERKTKIVAQAETQRRRLEVCQTVLSWIVDCY